MNRLGQKLRELREAKGLKVNEVAKALDKSPGYISRIETRDDIPSPEFLLAISLVIGGNPEELLELAKEAHLGRVERDIDAKYDQALALYRKAKQ